MTVEIRYIAEYDTQCFETKYIIYTEKKTHKKKTPKQTNEKNQSYLFIFYNSMKLKCHF